MAAPRPVVERAPAKINLDLLVLGRRPDGYHEIDSAVVFADLADELAAVPGDGLVVEAVGRFAADLPGLEENTVARAARRMAEAVGRAPAVRFRLTKNLPVAAGIGGGSADAAAALRALARLWRLPWSETRLRELALGLGADVPVCLVSRPVRMRGVGERLEPLGALPDLPLVLVNPGKPVPTGEVFRRLGPIDARPRPEPMTAVSAPAEVAAWLATSRNDLEPSAVAFLPEIEQVLAALRALPGCLLARMSGSGATCFGLFGDRHASESASETLRRRFSRWWISSTIARGAR